MQVLGGVEVLGGGEADCEGVEVEVEIDMGR